MTLFDLSQISVSKGSEIPLREQIFAQVVFLIGTRRLEPGAAVPSVRGLARRLCVHYNTVSQAYHDLASAGFLAGSRGGRLTVRAPGEPARQPKDLDDLINDTIELARRRGYTLQQLRQRVRERMLEAPPDHVLVVSDEAGMQSLLRAELTEALRCPVETCFAADLASNPGLAIGALILVPPGTMTKAVPFLSKSHPVVPILYSEAGPQLHRVRRSRQPSLIAVVSISQYFLDIARGVLSAMAGSRHSITEQLLAGDAACRVASADIVICDCVARPRLQIRNRRTVVIPYRLVSEECLEQVRSAITSAP